MPCVIWHFMTVSLLSLMISHQALACTNKSSCQTQVDQDQDASKTQQDVVPFKPEPVQKLLATFKERQDFPVVEGKKKKVRKGRSLPDWLHSDFQAIQQALFNHPVLELQSCRGCEITSDSSQKIVFADPDFINETMSNKSYHSPRSLLSFIMAHEISHYLYDLTIHEVHPQGQSLFGYPPLEFNSARPLDESQVYELAMAHAEIDYYAIVLLKEMGYSDIANDVSLFFQGKLKDFSTRNYEGSALEVRVRMGVLWVIMDRS